MIFDIVRVRSEADTFWERDGPIVGPFFFDEKNHSITSMELFAFNRPESGRQISASAIVGTPGALRTVRKLVLDRLDSITKAEPRGSDDEIRRAADPVFSFGLTRAQTKWRTGGQLGVVCSCPHSQYS